MRRAALVGPLVVAGLMVGCAEGPPPGEAARLAVVATTPVLADLAREVAGDRATVTSLVPAGADPHTYEPSLRDVRTVAYAGIAFSNYLMLEQHSVIKTIDASLPPGALNLSLAEEAGRYGATIIPLVENASLDTLWLGLRVRGTGAALGADRSSQVGLSLASVEGSGNLTAYTTGTFGEPHISFATHDGVDSRDRAELPVAAHTHLSWAFSKPGIYRTSFASEVTTAVGRRDLARGELIISVGADPRGIPELASREVLDRGHADLAVNLDTGTLELFADPVTGTEPRTLALDDVVVWVPPKAMAEIPASPSFRFLGRPGQSIHQLPQAVLGAHVHGEIDPHLWLSVPNAKAYVAVIRDALIAKDPDGAEIYRARATAYLGRLDVLDAEVRASIGRIPPERRHLVTTHDAYGYLAREYGLNVAGFVSQNPSVEPSMVQRRRLQETIRSLRVPAVFLERTVARASSSLAKLADDQGVQICPLYADTFDSTVTTYEALMRFNAASLARCLG